MSSSSPVDQIKACLADEAAYKKNRKPVVQQIAAGNKTYINALVDTAKTVLKDKKQPGYAKFIIIYFLKEAMDTKEPELVNVIREKLLKKLGEAAKSKPKEVFGASPDERVVKNFYQLLLEEIYFWSEWFGTDAKGKATKYRTVLEDVASHTQMPKKILFFTKEKPKKPETEGSQFKSSSSQPPEPQTQNKTPSQSGRDTSNKPQVAASQQKETPGKVSETPAGGKANVKQIYDLLRTIEGNKEVVTEILTGNDKPEMEMLDIMGEQFKDANKNLEGSLNDLFGMDFPEKENMLNKVLEESNFTSKYLSEHEKLKKGKITVDQFKSNILNAINSSKSPLQEPKETKNSKKQPQKEEPQPKKRRPDISLEPIPENTQPKLKNPAPRPQKNVDFEVNFNSAGGDINPMGSSQSSPFDNFQSTPVLQAGKSSSAFDDFDNFGNKPKQTPPSNNLFTGFETAPARPSNFRDSQPDSGAPQQRDDFGEFGNFEPQKNDFGTFNDFEAPRKASNRPPEQELQQTIQLREEPVVQNNQRPSVVIEEPFKEQVQFEANNGLEGLRGKRTTKKEEEEEKVAKDVGFEDFDDFDFDAHQNQDNEQSGFNFEYDGGRGRAGTPNSMGGSKDIFAETEPESQRHIEPPRRKVSDHRERLQQIQQPVTVEPDTGKFGDEFQGGYNESQYQRPPVQQSRVNQRQFNGEDWTIPSAQKETTSNRNESPFRGQNQSVLSSSQMIARSSVGAKFGDMESERLRMERDRILSELENVKRMYSGMKIEYDYLQRNHDTTGTDYNKLKQELDQLKRSKGQLSLNNDYLKSENDAFKKFRSTLVQENEGHVRLFEDMSKELAGLKERINEYDITDQRQRDNLRVNELENTLRNTQFKIDSMHNLHRTVHAEFDQANVELDRLRQGNLIESRINLSPPRHDLLGSNFNRPLDRSGGSYISLPKDIRSRSASPLQRERERSRSPQIVDLLSLERPAPIDFGKYERASMTSQNGLYSLNLQAGGVSNLGLYYDTANPVAEPYRQSLGNPMGGLSTMNYTSGTTLNQENKYSSQLLNLDRHPSPQRTYETTAPYVNNYVTSANSTQNAFSNLLGFVPKYSDIPPLGVTGSTVGTTQTPRKTEQNAPRLSLHNSLPQKYTSQGLGLTGSLTDELNTASFKSDNGALLKTEEYTLKTSSPYTTSNPSANKASALLEKARKLREQSMKGSTVDLNASTDTYTRRSVANNRPLGKSPQRDEIRIQNQDFITPPPGRESYKASFESNGQAGRRFSPEGERSNERLVHLEQERTNYHSRNYQIPPLTSQLNFQVPLVQDFQFQSNGREQERLATSTVTFENRGLLPEGLYQGSPIRERVINRAEVVELKPTETLRIVERVVRKSPQRSKSPIGHKSRNGSVKKGVRVSSPYKPSLASTLKNDLEVIKRSYEDGGNRYDYNVTKKVDRSRSRSPPIYANENINIYATSTTNEYSQGAYKVNPLVESIKKEIQALKSGSNSGSAYKARSSVHNENKREYEGGYSKEISLFGDSSTAQTRKFYNEKMTNSPYLTQGTGAPGVRLSMQDTYFNSYESKGYGLDRAPVISSNIDGVTQYNISGKKVKPENFRKVAYDYNLFDQFKNAIYSNQYFRDLDTFKNACLLKRATLFDSPFLQITSTSKNEGPHGPNSEIAKTIIHYTNKSLLDISEFTVQPLERHLQYTPQVQKFHVNQKEQLKQEFFVNFFDFGDIPYIVNLTFKQETSYKQMDVVLPLTIFKFMEFSHSVSRPTFKEAWKQVKANSSTVGYGKINAKFLINHTELNKYFENNLIDITPPINPKNKKKYGGVFRLPDNREYYLTASMDSSRVKFMIGSSAVPGGYEERIAQYLSFLFTV